MDGLVDGWMHNVCLFSYLSLAYFQVLSNDQSATSDPLMTVAT